jgi:exopolysaccharide biosynthesis predicted pyruvyltransferase EpsI
MNIHSFIDKYKDKAIHYKPNPGNGGDALIAFAAYKLFKEHQINYTIIGEGDDLKDKILFYAGGGNLVDNYMDCANFIQENLATAKEIVLLPHTISGHKELLKSLDHKVTLICREQVSYDYVKSFPNVKNVLLFDDLVLGVDFKSIFKFKSNVSRLLYVGQFRNMFSNVYRKRTSLEFFLKKRNDKPVLNAFRIDGEKTAIAIPEDNVDVSVFINFDSSMSSEVLVTKTVLNFVSFLNQFKVINTNRLHVCIAGALLGKEVNFYGNSYWKNKSVFDFSVSKRFPNVKWKQN